MASVSSLLKGSPPLINPVLLPAPYTIRYGSFGSTQTQPVLGVDQATAITYNTTFTASGVNYDPANPSRVVVSATGVYKFSYSVQLDKSGGGTSVCDLWIAIDGVVVPNSASRTVVVGQQGETFPYCEYILNLNQNQYVEVIFASPDASMIAEYFAPVGIYPAVPSIITNVVQIA